MKSRNTKLINRISLFLGILIIISLLWSGKIFKARADTPLQKNDPNQTEISEISTPAFIAQQPDATSKNAIDAKAPVGTTGVMFASQPDTISKNMADGNQTDMTNELLSVLGSGDLRSCGSSGNLNWTTTSSSFQVVRQCSLTLPQAGYVYISANASMAWQDGDYEAQFEIGIDGTGGDPDIDRWVNVYYDGADGTDETVALSVLKPVSAGFHTFYSLGKRYAGAGTVLVYDPTLTVIFIPASNSQVLPCGDSGNLNWTTTSSSFQVVKQCSLTFPQNGYVFISADASLGRQDGEYEAQFEIGIDDTGGDPNIDRWVNVYNDGADGTDRSATLSVLEPVSAGSHTFYSLGKRYAGAGTVLVYDPTLTVIFIPASNSRILPCGDSGNINWTTTSSSFQVVKQCSLSLTKGGYIFISANGSLSRQDGEYEAQFEIGIDDTGGDPNIDRWVNVYNDSGDGTDKSVALSVLKPVTAGAHTFYSLGKRYAGAGTVLVYDPTLTVVYIPYPETRLYLPMTLKR